MTEYPPIEDDLGNRLSALLKELLEAERQSVMGANVVRRHELFEKIERREAELNDDDRLYDELFERHIATLPEAKRPGNGAQKSRMFGAWEKDLKSELADWKNELKELKNWPVDKKLIFNSARNKVIHLLQREAQGNKNVQDYLIPVVRLMRNGKNHTEAFHIIANELEVNYNTVSSQCTRELGLSTKEFIEHVESSRISQIMKNKYPDKRELIERKLG